MIMKNFKKLNPVILLLTLLILVSCSKTEFLPDPEGVALPYDDKATQTVDELLAASPAKLYYSIWQKSKVRQTLTSDSKKVYSVFAPDDAAMEASGLTSTAINALPIEELDSIVMYYTTLIKVSDEELRLRQDNFIVKTMLERKDLRVPYYESDKINRYDNFFYRHFVGIRNNELLMNGRSVGTLDYHPATNGAVYIIKKAVPKPVKTLMEALKADGRFTIFLESQRIADEIYITKIGDALEPLFGYRPSPEEMIYYLGSRVMYEKGWGVDEPSYPGSEEPNLFQSVVFAPTDEAFHKAGFNSLNDVLEFNELRGNVFFDENTYSGSGGFPMDTIYSYHRNFGRVHAPSDPGYGKAPSNATVFFSNVLNERLNTYMVNIGGNPPIEYAYQMPLEFVQAEDGIHIKPKESEYPAAKVIDADINTLNGPIQVVDHLLIPKGFKLK